MKLVISEPDYSSPLWADIPADLRTQIRAVINAVKTAPKRGLTNWFKTTAPTLGLQPGGLKKKYYDLVNGGDWTLLIDQRCKRGNETRTGQRKFVAFLLTLVDENQRKSAPAIRELWRLWRTREKIIPGYEDWPSHPALPEGWGKRNLMEIIKREHNKAAQRAVRVGTSSKTNQFLPHVITTRVGLWPGAVIQLDDMWHDNYVTVRRGDKPVIARVLELAAMDLFSAHRFHWGCKPRLRRDDGTMENIGGKDGRLFLAGLLHRFGRCPRGMAFMVEHETMSIPEDVERLLYDYSGGWIRVMRQAIEGKQAALTGYWSGSEGGNFRAKALIESIGNLIHNDLARLPMQMGSPSSGLLGPVTTERHRKWMTKAIDAIHKLNPKRLDFLRTGILDFHSQFVPFLADYYEHGLGARTDHELEGWEEMNLFADEYTISPGSDQWISEELILGGDFDPEARAIILAAARSNPDKWKRSRKMQPREVWQRRERWLPVPPALICDILSRDLARECTARKGFITFSDKELAPFPLVYEARFVSGPRQGQEIGHGEKVEMFALPYDERFALAVDAKGRYLGELPLYKKVTTIDPAAFGSTAPFEERPDIVSEELKRAAAHKHERIADILEPVRIRHAERVQDARELRAEAKRLADPKQAVTAEELVEALAAKRTARSSAAASDLAEEALANIPAHVESDHTDDLDF